MSEFTFALDLPPGLFSDDTTFAKKGWWATGYNIRFFQGRPETLGGVSTAISGATTAINKLLAYTVSGTLNIAIAGTLLQRSTIGGSPTNITPASGWDASSRHCLDMWGDELLASCLGGKLFVSVAGAQATEITQSPDAITCMLVTKTRQVMALGCNEEVSGTFNGRCIRFSNIEDYTDWTTSATNNAGEIILPGQSNIVSGCRLGEYIAAWTSGALFLGTFIGDPSQPWNFQRVANIGLEGLDAFAVAGDTVYWITPDKRFFAYTPGGQPAEIPCPISRDFEAAGAWSSAYSASSARAVVNRRYSEVWFFPPATNQYFYIYHLNESGEAPVWSIGGIIDMIGIATATMPAIIDDPLLKTAGVATTMLASAPHLANPLIRWVDVVGTAANVSSLVSADMYIDEARRRVMVKRFTPDYEAQSNSTSFIIAYRDRPQSSALSTSYSIATSDTKKDLRKSGMIFAFTFGGAGDTRWRLGKPTLDCVTLGER